MAHSLLRVSVVSWVHSKLERVGDWRKLQDDIDRADERLRAEKLKTVKVYTAKEIAEYVKRLEESK